MTQQTTPRTARRYTVYLRGEFGGRYGLEWHNGRIYYVLGSDRVYTHPVRRDRPGDEFDPAWVEMFRRELRAEGVTGPMPLAWE